MVKYVNPHPVLVDQKLVRKTLIYSDTSLKNVSKCSLVYVYTPLSQHFLPHLYAQGSAVYGFCVVAWSN